MPSLLPWHIAATLALLRVPFGRALLLWGYWRLLR